MFDDIDRKEELALYKSYGGEYFVMYVTKKLDWKLVELNETQFENLCGELQASLEKKIIINYCPKSYILRTLNEFNKPIDYTKRMNEEPEYIWKTKSM